MKHLCCHIDHNNENQTTDQSCPVPQSMVFGVCNIKDIFLCIISKALENQEPQISIECVKVIAILIWWMPQLGTNEIHYKLKHDLIYVVPEGD